MTKGSGSPLSLRRLVFLHDAEGVALGILAIGEIAHAGNRHLLGDGFAAGSSPA